MADFHRARLVVLVVQDVGVGVEDRADAVPAELAHRRVAVRRDRLLDYRADARVGLARLAVVDCRLPAVVGHLDELASRVVDLAHQERLRAVPVIAAVVAGHVDVDDVAVAQNTSVWDAVADDLIDRGAARLGEAVVVQRARIGAALGRLIVHHPVDLVGSHAHLHRSRCCVQHLARDPPCGAHSLDVLFRLDLDLPGKQRPTRLGPPVARVVRTHNARRHLACRRALAGPHPPRVPEAVLRRAEAAHHAHGAATRRAQWREARQCRADRGGNQEIEHAEWAIYESCPARSGRQVLKQGRKQRTKSPKAAGAGK